MKMCEVCLMIEVVVGVCGLLFFFFKQKTAYEMRISDWSSDVCSSDLLAADLGHASAHAGQQLQGLFAGMESLRRSVGHRTGGGRVHGQAAFGRGERGDRKSTRLNSSH